jgi:hypothetical protein
MELVCTRCHVAAEPAQEPPGDIAVEIGAWVVALAAGLALFPLGFLLWGVSIGYSVYRRSRTVASCVSCECRELVAPQSPRGRALMAQYAETSAAEPAPRTAAAARPAGEATDAVRARAPAPRSVAPAPRPAGTPPPMPSAAPARPRPDGTRLRSHAITALLVVGAVGVCGWLAYVAWDVVAARRGTQDRARTSQEQAALAGSIGSDIEFTSDAVAAPDPGTMSRGTELVLLVRENTEARAAPSLGAVPVLQVVKGERLRVADQVGEWYRIGDSPAGVEAWIQSEWVRTGTVPQGRALRETVIADMSPEIDAFVRRNPYLEAQWTWEHVASRDSIVLSFTASPKGEKLRTHHYVPGWCSKIQDIGKRVAPGVKFDPVFSRSGIPTWCSAEPE